MWYTRSDVLSMDRTRAWEVTGENHGKVFVGTGCGSRAVVSVWYT